VLPRIVQKPDDVVVVKAVVRKAAGPAHLNQSRGSKQTELMRKGRLADPYEFSQVADTPLAVAERINHSNPGRITKQLEDVGHRGNRGGGEHPRPDVRQRLGIVRVDGLAAVVDR